MPETHSAYICPVCSKADQTYKVSVLYLEASNFLHNDSHKPSETLQRIIKDIMPDCTDIKQSKQLVFNLIQQFKPPMGKSKIHRTIHPDGMVLFLLIIFLIMLIQSINQPNQNLVGLIFVAVVFFSSYIFFRKKILEKYQQKKLRDQLDVARIEEAISQWMDLMYCSRDKVRFHPRSGQVFLD